MELPHFRAQFDCPFVLMWKGASSGIVQVSVEETITPTDPLELVLPLEMMK